MREQEISMNNYYKYVDLIKQLIKENKDMEAEKILLKIIELNEINSFETGEGVAPYYYEELSKVYKKRKDRSRQVEILHRYLIQIKARGNLPKKIYEQYLKTKVVVDVENEMKEVYNEYLLRIEKIKQKKVKRICPCCKKEIILIVPDGVEVFGSCCPICLESSVF